MLKIILCDCDGCDYYRRTTDVDKLQNSLDVHEIIQSHNQIVSSRQNIEENEYLRLIRDKRDFLDYYESSVGGYLIYIFLLFFLGKFYK